MNLNKGPKPVSIRRKAFWDLLEFHCRYLRINILIRSRKRLKNSFSVLCFAKTIKVMNSVTEESMDERFQLYAKGNQKEVRIPEVKVGINKSRFDFDDFF